MDRTFQIMTALIVFWILFLAAALGTGLFILGRWTGVW